MNRFVTALCLVLAAVSAQAGEYSSVSFGLALDYTSQSTSKVPFQNVSGNIQGADADKLLGIGLTTQVRLGEVISQRVSGLVLTPTISYRFGTVNESEFYSNLAFYAPDGSVVYVQNANSTRKTANRQISLSVPLRYYFGGSAAYGGFFAEAGPVYANVQQNVDLSVSGLILAIPSSVQESARITSSLSGYTVGLGTTWIYRQSQVSLILSYQTLGGIDGRKSSSETRGGIQWTF